MSNLIARAAIVLLAGGALSAGAHPQLTVSPETGLIDQPFHVEMRDVVPGSRVTITASRPDAAGHLWTAVGEYSADAEGRVDTAVSPSLGGSYRGFSPHGLWCSALPVRPDRLGTYIADLPHHPDLGTSPKLDVGRTYPITLTARINGRTVASARAMRTYVAEGVVPEEVTAADDVRGVFFPASSLVARGAPVVVLSGSGGGISEAQAALLASHGHPALALALFGYRDLPPALFEVPLERIRAGAVWLAHRTHARRVVVMGTSRGSEAAGLAASYFPQDFSAAVLYLPSHLVNDGFGPGVGDLAPAWTLAGKPLPPDPGNASNAASNDAIARAGPTGPFSKAPGVAGTPSALPSWNDAKVTAEFGIPFERARGSLLAIAAGADEMWPSYIAAVQIQRRLAAHGKGSLAEIHIYPGAGHLISRVGAGGPMSSFIFIPDAKVFLATGGLPNANCEDSYDAWGKVLTFLAKLPTPGARDSGT